MKVKLVERAHRRACRDPSWYLDYVRLIGYAGMVVYGVGSLVLLLGTPPAWLAILVVPYAIPFLVWAYERYVDKCTDLDGQLVISDSTLGSLTIVGRRSQIHRVTHQHLAAGSPRRCYRTGLSDSQHWVLLMIVLGVLPLIRMCAAAPLDTMAIVCMATFGTLLGQVAVDRRRYRVESGVLTIEQLTYLSVRDTVTIPLAGSQVVCDFAEGQLSILASDRTVFVPLTELLNPHAFVASLISCTRRSVLEVGSVGSTEIAASL